jgi:hypothetical protein
VLPNAFIGKLQKPTEDDLTAELGSTKALWDHLLADLVAEFHTDAQEWNSYSIKAGWSLRVKQKKRAILYMSPCRGCFQVSFALGDKAMQSARQSKLPAKVLKLINEAKRYPEGSAVRIEVGSPGDVAIVKKLASFKLAN